MNYGEKVLEIYNKEFLKLKNDFIKFLKSNFDADETFTIIFSKYLKKLSDLQKTQYSKDPLLMECWEEFWFRYDKYTKNAVNNIINKEISEKFNENLSRSTDGIKQFTDFLESLAKLSIAKDYEKKIRNDFSQIEEAFINKDVSTILKVKKQEGAEYLIDYWKPVEKLQKINKSKGIDNPFTKDEKFILIHYMFRHERVRGKKLSTFEITLILKIVNECFSNEELIKKKNTDYEKLHQGYGYYKKTTKEKKELMKLLIEKVNQFSFKMFAEYLHAELHKL